MEKSKVLSQTLFISYITNSLSLLRHLYLIIFYFRNSVINSSSITKFLISSSSINRTSPLENFQKLAGKSSIVSPSSKVVWHIYMCSNMNRSRDKAIICNISSFYGTLFFYLKSISISIFGYFYLDIREIYNLRVSHLPSPTPLILITQPSHI